MALIFCWSFRNSPSVCVQLHLDRALNISELDAYHYWGWGIHRQLLFSVCVCVWVWVSVWVLKTLTTMTGRNALGAI